MKRSTGVMAVAILATLFLAPPARADGLVDCSAPPELIEDTAKLPAVAQRLRQHKPVKIVAIGGSSTAGTAVASPSEAYPARLQEELSRRYPGIAFTVINRGVPRQTAQEMVDRFPQDVLRESPALVIWETGTTDAVRGVDEEEFSATLEAGISALHAQQIDVMLMDMQYSKHTASVLPFDRYLEIMHRISDLTDVYLFQRFELMRYWSENELFDFDDVPKAELNRASAAVYECIGKRLADAIGYAAR